MTDLCFEYSISLSLASNGNPQNPDSLHYIDPSGRLNSYQRVRLCILWCSQQGSCFSLALVCVCIFFFFPKHQIQQILPPPPPPPKTVLILYGFVSCIFLTHMPKEEEKTQNNLEIACKLRKNSFYIELVQKEAHTNNLGKKK